MAISKEQLAKIIASKAGGLCTPEADRKLNGMAGRTNVNEMYDPDPASFGDYSDDPWGMPGQFESRQPQQRGDFNYNNSTASNSRMPEAIKASLLENRIDTSSLSNMSVIDQLGIDTTKKQQRPVREERTVQQPVSGVDYALIKSIVKECLAEAQSAILTEGNLNQIHLSGGKIKLVDNSGNIYSAKLEKTGNLKDRK